MIIKRTRDNQKFVRLATARVNRTIRSLRLISNLANRSNYSYTKEQLSQIFIAIDDEVAEMKEALEQIASTETMTWNEKIEMPWNWDIAKQALQKYNKLIEG